MPYPSQITHEQILEATERLIEEKGVEFATLNDVATSLGVKTPSLYRYVDSRTELLKEVNLRFLNGLFDAMSAASESQLASTERMLAVMGAYRRYAHDHPGLYLMSFAYMVDELRPGEDFLVRLVLPLQWAMVDIAGPERSLGALRSVLAFVHGFVMLELTNQLRRGGDLGTDFVDGARALLAGWKATT